jgi:ribonuclease III
MTTQDKEKKMLCIYNPTNHLVDLHTISAILERCQLTYIPQNINIYQLSLTHKSYIHVSNYDVEFEYVPNCVELQSECNERLEYLGDSIIGSIISSYLFHRYPRQNEGFLTKIKTKIVRTKMLANFSIFIGLQEHILISKYVEDMCGGRSNERILEDVFEAFMGALFEDIYRHDSANYGFAMQICADFLIYLVENTIDFRLLISINDNYKELLLQYYHKAWGCIHPIYRNIKEEGPTNKRFFTMGVYHPISGELIGQGTDRKKITAEQIASKEALHYFDLYPQNVSSDRKKIS